MLIKHTEYDRDTHKKKQFKEKTKMTSRLVSTFCKFQCAPPPPHPVAKVAVTNLSLILQSVDPVIHTVHHSLQNSPDAFRNNPDLPLWLLEGSPGEAVLIPAGGMQAAARRIHWCSDMTAVSYRRQSHAPRYQCRVHSWPILPPS